MEELFFNFIDQFGYFAVAALIFIENIFPPIPSELILPLSGFFTTTTDMVLPLVIVSATAGSVLGAYILYGIGWVLSRERLMHFFDTKPMRLLGFKGTDIASAVDWFDRKGQFTVLLCRCIPVVRSLISIPAGVARMNFPLFLALTLAGSLIWNSIFVVGGYLLGGQWHRIEAVAGWFSNAVVAAIGVLVVAFLVRRWLQERAQARLESDGRPAE